MGVNKIVPQHLCMHNCTPFGPRDRGRLGALIRLRKERARKQLNFVKSKGGGGGGGDKVGEESAGWGGGSGVLKDNIVPCQVHRWGLEGPVQIMVQIRK